MTYGFFKKFAPGFDNENENWKIYKKLWENAPVGYHILDKKGTIIKVNMTEAKMLGYKPSEIIGRSYFDFVVPEERKEARDNYIRIIKGEKSLKKYGRTLVRKNNSRLSALIHNL